MANFITLYISNNNLDALIGLGKLLATCAGALDVRFSPDDENDLVGVTLGFASKDAAASFSDQFTMYGGAR